MKVEFYERTMNHKKLVLTALKEMRGVFPKSQTLKIMEDEVLKHDDSKFSDDEAPGYTAKFHTKPPRKEDDPEHYEAYMTTVEEDFNRAWLHHVHNNPHHWNHWVLISSKGKLTPLEMPKKDAIHMCLDWIAMSYEFGGTALEYFNKIKENAPIHPKTKEDVQTLLEAFYNDKK